MKIKKLNPSTVQKFYFNRKRFFWLLLIAIPIMAVAYAILHYTDTMVSNSVGYYILRVSYGSVFVTLITMNVWKRTLSEERKRVTANIQILFERTKEACIRKWGKGSFSSEITEEVMRKSADFDVPTCPVRKALEQLNKSKKYLQKIGG
jgi:hypothetical protein